MAKAKPNILASVLILNFFFAACAIQESRSQVALPYRESISDIFSPTQKESLFQVGINKEVLMKRIRRMMIGSIAPTCTYNECRGCRFKCRAEQVPVEGNDPINSAYHYRCVCHRDVVLARNWTYKSQRGSHGGTVGIHPYLHKMAKLSKSQKLVKHGGPS